MYIMPSTQAAERRCMAAGAARGSESERGGREACDAAHLTTSELIDSTLHVVDHGARLRQRQAVRVDLLGIPWLLE